MPVTVVLGSQWGDEGKGKLADILAGESNLCCRCQGGNNAGHTIVVGDKKFDFHLLPSGLINPHCVNVIGNGVVVHIPSLFKELESIEAKGVLVEPSRLRISDRAHIVFDFHQIVDGLKEVELGLSNIGTTKRGIGPAYSAKASRSGMRMHHLLSAYDGHVSGDIKWEDSEFVRKLRVCIENRMKRYGPFDYDIENEVHKYLKFAARLKPFVTDTIVVLHDALALGNNILVEGANALMLDLDCGTYPYVTSSNCSVGGVCTGLSLPPSKIDRVIGVVKAYTTRVGGGPFPTEQLNDFGEKLQTVGHEYGVTTGRKRRCGWLDLVVLKYSTMINGYTSLNLTKVDVLDDFEEIQIGVAYMLDGKELSSFPADLDLLEKIEVKYESVPGWKQSIAGCRSYQELPEACRNYIKRIEDFTGVRVQWIGVGAERDAMIQIF